MPQWSEINPGGSDMIWNTERRNYERRLLERIRALDPTILDCGPACQHFERHDEKVRP
jgi:hypothetical protein